MALTGGLTNVCSSQQGGLTTVWLIDSADFTSASVTASQVTAVVISGSWSKFEFREDTGQRINTGELVESGAFTVKHEVNFRRTGIDTEVVIALHEMIASNPCKMIGIVKDTNGKKWLEGYSEPLLKERGLKLNSGLLDSGAAITDGPGVDFSLMSEDGRYALEYTGADPS